MGGLCFVDKLFLFKPFFSFHSLVIDVTMALDTLSLPVLEPLTPGRLLDMTVLALSCLYAGKLWRFDLKILWTHLFKVL